MKTVLLSSVLALSFVADGAARPGPPPSGCMRCHGDEAAMQSMVKAVVQGSSEGEG